MELNFISYEVGPSLGLYEKMYAARVSYEQIHVLPQFFFTQLGSIQLPRFPISRPHPMEFNFISCGVGPSLGLYEEMYAAMSKFCEKSGRYVKILVV